MKRRWIPLILEGCAALIALLVQPSEAKNALIGSFSAARLAMCALCLFLMAGVFYLFHSRRCYTVFWPGWLMAWAGGLTLIACQLTWDPANFLAAAARRALPLLIYITALGVQFCLLDNPAPLKRPYAKALAFTIPAALYAGFAAYYDSWNWMTRLDYHLPIWLTLIAVGWLWAWAEEQRHGADVFGALFCAALAYAVIRSTALWMGRVNTPSSAYWNELAESFLHGRLYLADARARHDLTQFAGHWYVPNPPMPALLLVPWLWITGGTAESVNMCVYSALTGAVNAALAWLLLRAANRKDLFKCSKRTAFWLMCVLIFGTDHLWLSTSGQMWFISQTVVIGFTLAAALLTVNERSPLWIGLMLGGAVLSRPNVFPVYLCLLGIRLWQTAEFPRVPWKQTLCWCVLSALPVCAAAGLTLWYNYARFGDWFDFGYVTINGADWIMKSVETYGMFHPHFFMTNLRTMLLALPRLDFSGTRFWFYPYVNGFSIFLMTPPLVYCCFRLRKNWWIIGASSAVLLTVTLLLFYHNTGAEQIGYRYILDASAPLLLLMGNGLHGRKRAVFYALAVFSFCVSFVGIYWWYLGRV